MTNETNKPETIETAEQRAERLKQVYSVVMELLAPMEEKFPIVAPMELSVRQELANGKKENVTVGTVSVMYPMLESFGLIAPHDLEAESKRKPSDMMPVYKDIRHAWLFTAVCQKVEAFARSKTDSGKVKDGMTIAECFSDLTEQGERGGAHLKNRADALKGFQAYFETLEQVPKKPVIGMYGSFMAAPESLLGASANVFKKFCAHVDAWTSKLSDDEKARFEKTLVKVAESVAVKVEMLKEEESDE